MKFKSEIIRCNIPNKNGRVYSKEVIEDALDSPVTKEKLENGCFFGYILDDSVPNNYDDISMADISHRLLNYWWEDTALYGEFETLDTPKGRALESLLNTQNVNCMALSGYGDLKAIEDGYTEVENFELTSIDFTRDKA